MLGKGSIPKLPSVSSHENQRITFGQITFGLSLSFLNCLYRRKPVHIIDRPFATYFVIYLNPNQCSNENNFQTVYMDPFCGFKRFCPMSVVCSLSSPSSSKNSSLSSNIVSSHPPPRKGHRSFYMCLVVLNSQQSSSSRLLNAGNSA